jgi:hypothetical protein
MRVSPRTSSLWPFCPFHGFVQFQPVLHNPNVQSFQISFLNIIKTSRGVGDTWIINFSLIFLGLDFMDPKIVRYMQKSYKIIPSLSSCNRERFVTSDWWFLAFQLTEIRSISSFCNQNPYIWQKIVKLVKNMNIKAYQLEFLAWMISDTSGKVLISDS